MNLQTRVTSLMGIVRAETMQDYCFDGIDLAAATDQESCHQQLYVWYAMCQKDFFHKL